LSRINFRHGIFCVDEMVSAFVWREPGLRFSAIEMELPGVPTKPSW
jgi:hypothetical protein